MTIDPRSNPVRAQPQASALGRVYGISQSVNAASVVGRVGPKPEVEPAAQPVSRAQRSVSAQSVRSLELDKIVAGIVPGSVGFEGGQPEPEARLAFYKRPTDRNEVATVLSLGKRLDVTG